ncbi:deoxyribodipyrimidine photo-lyase type II [Desulfobotulus alkaliphilus]|uniref:Deoxyribodipyrimidine photo-lyase n=1 Tax=Desulfobotulus alkaliphilus TaxID=622671 RepID=A0A562S788_9BACT|nr:deoxyribodipyrimidine photo-lyase [Desulfobotulus alkaliphilus]TWI77257.1 deoxyribodipyrimidine photo-lyase type II [Desulfobotulus alkaliphilus]
MAQGLHAFSRVERKRIQRKNDRGFCAEASYVLYWMQQAQRVEDNPALAFALETAAFLKKPLVVAFSLWGYYPEARWPHFVFMLEGLQELALKFQSMGIVFVLRIGEPEDTIYQLAGDAAALICDVGYLRHQKIWRENLGRRLSCAVFAVEASVVVPVAEALDRRAYAAYVLRPKIMEKMVGFLEPATLLPAHPFKGPPPSGENPGEGEALLHRAGVPWSPMPEAWFFTGGEKAALGCLDDFLKQRAGSYVKDRSLPHRYAVSFLSPFLHFGMISPGLVVRRVQAAELEPEVRTAFLEQFVVRRELAVNFVHYTPDYDNFGCLPPWARDTLDQHRRDERPYLYTLKALENASTHDIYWNAAMEEMRLTGYMHNVMRMYWGKKILEWSPSPEEAFERILYLNNRFFLDGRDPCSYAGCGWIFGLHDRPWPSRQIFGSVRFMAASGLERKSRIAEYVRHVDGLPGILNKTSAP